MAEPEIIRQLVDEAIDELNATLPPGERVGKEPASPLMGGGKLDSLGVVDLMMILEQKLADRLDARVSLALTSATSGGAEGTPFATVGSLIEHVTSLVNQAR
jgi:acyl carrier protein